MQRILIFVDWYLPGYKGGGQIKAVEYIVKNLSDQFEFFILCRDHDSDGTPYDDLKKNEWIPSDGIHIKYLSGSKWTYLRSIAKELSAHHWDAIYTNSFFSSFFSIFPLAWATLLKRSGRKLIMAPRGEFSPGALGIKRHKKLFYIAVARLIGLYRHVTWHVSTPLEKQDVTRHFTNAKVMVASELLPPSTLAESTPIVKQVDELRLVFLSRITQKKGLDISLAAINRLTSGTIVFDIYGPAEDKAYWQQCLDLMEAAPPNVTIHYCGEILHSEVKKTIAGYHFLLFPTLGENFGYVIIEALLAGRPVLISDTTPWVDLEERGAGHDFAAGDCEKIARILGNLVALDDAGYRKYLASVSDYAAAYLATQRELIAENAKLFQAKI